MPPTVHPSLCQYPLKLVWLGEVYSPSVESGLSLWLALANRIKVMVCQFWVKASRGLFAFVFFWTQPLPGLACRGVRNHHVRRWDIPDETILYQLTASQEWLTASPAHSGPQMCERSKLKPAELPWHEGPKANFPRYFWAIKIHNVLGH